MRLRTKMKLALPIVLTSAIILVVLLLLFVPLSSTKIFDANEYNYSLSYSKELDNIPVISQKTAYTCYAVSMSIVEVYLGFDVTEQDLLNELGFQDRKEGLLPAEYLSNAKKVFDPLSYSISLLNPKSEAEILNIITASLMNDLPVIIFYASEDEWNRPKYNTHYSVIYGIDMERETIKLSNPYGYLQELSFAELYDGLDYESYVSQPFTFRLGRIAGVIHENNIFVLEHIGQ